MNRQRTPLRPSDFGEVDLICFSHLRWGFVYQRPQHLMSRFAKHRRVFFVEEPVFDTERPELRLNVCPKTGVHVVVPAVPKNIREDKLDDCLRGLISSLFKNQSIRKYAAWFYTPMALKFADDLRPAVSIYDCMDELSLFRGAPPELIQNEQKLFARTDLVFTGGLSLFEAKCEQHPRVYTFPSSVDVPHFARARCIRDEPADQRNIPRPRIGYAGVIDERVNTALLADIAKEQPDWQIVMIGPVVKIPVESLPIQPNIHYLGMKQYSELPAYFASWDAAMLPFAMNDSTRFISPTKTPEYLAAGLPVISTPIRDVVRPYGELGLARIVGNAEEFVAAMSQVATYGMTLKWRERADAFLSTLSWDKTWGEMNHLMLQVIAGRERTFLPATAIPPQALAAKAGSDV
ncbi:MAG: glycosyltransferase family 1 protein [Bryobacteraceae bacterium]